MNNDIRIMKNFKKTYWLVFVSINFSIAQSVAQFLDEIVIKNPGLYPEGLVYDSKSEVFYTTSVSQGKITKVDKYGNSSVFVDDKDLISTIGIELDQKRNRLIVCNSDPGVGVKSSNLTKGKLASLAFYDLKTGEKEKNIDLGSIAPSGGHLANDLTMDDKGNLYITDSFAPIIYKVSQKGEVSIFINDKRLAAPTGTFGLNGLVYHPEGFLIAAVYNGGKLFKIPINKPSDLKQIELGEKSYPTIDGVLLLDNETIALSSNNLTGADFPSAVYQIKTSDNWISAKTTSVFKTGRTFPTTLVKVKEDVFVLKTKLHVLFGGKDPVAQEFEIAKVDFIKKKAETIQQIKNKDDMPEKKFMIVNAILNPREKEAFAFYSENSAPLFKKAGGTPVGKFKITQSLVGNMNLHILVIMEFPSAQAIKDVFESEEYKKLLPFRDKAFGQLEVYIGNQ
tara:strand:- start:4078 stop:5430 length:1353 start_codon:yes stop_codon:yes gene_type:complete